MRISHNALFELFGEVQCESSFPNPPCYQCFLLCLIFNHPQLCFVNTDSEFCQHCNSAGTCGTEINQSFTSQTFKGLWPFLSTRCNPMDLFSSLLPQLRPQSPVPAVAANHCDSWHVDRREFRGDCVSEKAGLAGITGYYPWEGHLSAFSGHVGHGSIERRGLLATRLDQTLPPLQLRGHKERQKRIPQYTVTLQRREAKAESYLHPPTQRFISAWWVIQYVCLHAAVTVIRDGYSTREVWSCW